MAHTLIATMMVSLVKNKLKILLLVVACTTAIILLGFFIVTITWISYANQEIRFEHFAMLATILTLFVNAAFLWALLRQIRQGEQSLKISREAADEALRARIDTRAPNVVVHIDEKMTRLTLPKNKNNKVSNKYKLPDDGDIVINFHISGTLKNEGISTARVYTNGSAIFNEAQANEIDPMTRNAGYEGDVEQVYIQPGEQCRFVRNEERTVQKWYDSLKQEHEKQPWYKTGFVIFDLRRNVNDIINIQFEGNQFYIDKKDQSQLTHVDKKVKYFITYDRSYLHDE